MISSSADVKTLDKEYACTLFESIFVNKLEPWLTGMAGSLSPQKTYT